MPMAVDIAQVCWSKATAVKWEVADDPASSCRGGCWLHSVPSSIGSTVLRSRPPGQQQLTCENQRTPPTLVMGKEVWTTKRWAGKEARLGLIASLRCPDQGSNNKVPSSAVALTLISAPSRCNGNAPPRPADTSVC